jgi:hypothetical protein
VGSSFHVDTTVLVRMADALRRSADGLAPERIAGRPDPRLPETTAAIERLSRRLCRRLDLEAERLYRLAAGLADGADHYRDLDRLR